MFKGNPWPANTSKDRGNKAKNHTKWNNRIICGFFYDQYMVSYYTEGQYYKT